VLRCPRCYRAFEAPSRFCIIDGEALTDQLLIDPFGGPLAKQTKQQYEILEGKYVVRGFIGKGATSRVYLAEDLEHNQPVAVKVLDSDFAKNHGAEERFFREARAAQRIVHDNVVRIVDIGHRADGMPFLVMEFLFGESLGARLQREKKLPIGKALELLRQAGAGLAAAHEAGIVHRDVKSDNLFLVGEPGASYAVKLLDFGLARLKELPSLTGLGTAVGTMEFMAPEQVVTELTDHRTDIYGLGVVMYRMLTGHLPFDRDDDVRLLASQLVLEPPRPRELNPELDARVEAVILRAIKKCPENRYPTMEELLQDLERLAGVRSGDLFAESPLPTPLDVYQPSASFARAAARYFYKQLGLVPVH
jgi:eukaryotic-like serine/threonine-protein kinase